MRDTQRYACALHNVVPTSRETLEKIYEHVIIFTTTWHALLHLTRIATHRHAHYLEYFSHWHAKLRALA